MQLKHVVIAIVAALGTTISVPGEVVDGFEDLGADGTAVASREIAGVTVSIATNGPLLTARTYNASTDVAFLGAADVANVPLNPENVSGNRFISGRVAGTIGTEFDSVQPIVFLFSTPIQSFGLTTLDVLENREPATSQASLIAKDALGDVVDIQTRIGPQGPTGLDLDWLVFSGQQNIVRVELIGEVSFGPGFGIDDLVVVVPEPSAACLLVIGSFGVLHRRSRGHPSH